MMFVAAGPSSIVATTFLNHSSDSNDWLNLERMRQKKRIKGEK
jgi:hypothetical protein